MNYAYAQTDSVKVAVNMNAWDAIWNASPVVQLTLLLLIAMSVICWAIIFQKRKQFLRADVEDDKFNQAFWRANSLDEVHERMEDFSHSSTAQVFESGFQELQRMAESSWNEKKPLSGETPLLTGSDNLIRSLRKSTDKEIAFFESRLSFLATTGSTSPFIGLFGTVWGIMSAFQKIGATGTASLAVVAPGISEALIATAIGLATAIPAVVAYNHFYRR
jgi:biopolymer transport protein TolQ